MRELLNRAKLKLDEIIKAEDKYGQEFKIFIITILCSILLFLILGKEGYDNTIGKLNKGVLATALFVIFWIYAFKLVEFYKSKEKINEIFSNYVMIFCIINFGILMLKGMHLFQIFKFDYTEIIEEVICLIISGIFWFKIKNRNKESKDDKLKGELFDSRKLQSDALIKLLEDDRDNSMILINGEWGIGKTFFVKKTLKKNEDIKEIFIDVMLFNSRKSLKDELFVEIESILEDNGIATKSIREMNEYMDSIIESENKLINLALKFLKSKTFQKGKDGVEESIKKLTDKKIVVVIDNLERVLKKEDVIEIMGFLHEIQSIEKISFIVCADKEKLKKMLEDDNYVEKFFLQEIELRGIEVVEIVEKIGEREEYLEYKENINRVLKKIRYEIEDYKKNKEESEKNKEESEKNKEVDKLAYIFNKKTKIPREIERIYEKVILKNNLFKNIYIGYLSDIKHLEIIIRVCILKIIFEVECKKKKEEEYFEKLGVEKNSLTYKFIDRIESEADFWSNILDSESEIEKMAYLRVINNWREVDNIKKYVENFDIEKVNIYEAFKNIEEYYKYIDFEDLAIEKYKIIREKINKLMENEYIEILKMEKIIELEKRFLDRTITNETIFDRFKQLNNYINIEKIGFNIKKVYFDDLYFFYKERTEDGEYEAIKKYPVINFIVSVVLKYIKDEKENKEYIELYSILKESYENKSYMIDYKRIINNFKLMESIFIENLEKSDIEGKGEIKKSTKRFFSIVMKIYENKYQERIEEYKLGLEVDLKNKNYFEQIDLLNKIRKNAEFKDFEDLKKETENILPDVKVEFYNVLNIVKERAEKTDNQ